MKGSLVLLLAAALFGCSQAGLPSNFVGVWVGIPEYSEIGPWGTNLNFTITQLDDDGDEWWMRDTFPESLGVGIGGFQDWWVYEESQSMHYCGCLRDFFSSSVPQPTTRAYYDITTETDKQMTFCLRGTDQECDTTWTLTLKDDDTLVSEYKFPSPIKHLYVTLKRDSPSPSFSPEEKKTSQDASSCGAEYFPTCFGFNQEKNTISKGREGTVACPYAGLKHYFGGLLGHKETEKKQKKSRPVHPRTGQTLQNCYIFNEVVGYQYSWTYNETEQAIDAMIQVPVTDETTYVAFGIAQDWDDFPNAPGMNNTDIVMGWADNGCVVSLYSAKEDGAPGVSTDQVLTDTSSSYEDGILTVSYTRPFNTGHHTITAGRENQVIWSSGSVKPSKNDPTVCTDASWNYHSNERGRRMIIWNDGPATFDPTMAC